MIGDIVTEVVSAATTLLEQLGLVLTTVVELVYANEQFSELGLIIVATAGFALAWSGIRFVFAFISRLLNKTRAGR